MCRFAYLVWVEGAGGWVRSEQPAERLSVADRRTVDGSVEAFQVGLIADVEEAETEQAAREDGHYDERQRPTTDPPAVPGEDVAEELLHILVQRSHHRIALWRHSRCESVSEWVVS